MKQMKKSSAQSACVPACMKSSCVISALLGCMFFVRPFFALISKLDGLSLLVISLALLLSLLGLLPSVSKVLGTVQV